MLDEEEPVGAHGISNGVRRTVEGWFEEFVDDVYGFAARRLGPEVGGDVTSETFRIALERFDSFDPQRGSPRGWLMGIASNLISRQWRTEARRLRLLGRAASVRPIAVDPLLRVEQRVDAERQLDALIGAIEDLHRDDRDLLFLVAWENLSHAEIAALIGIPVGTVKSRLHRIRAVLRLVETEVTS